MDEKNARTTLDNTADDIQEARDDNGCDVTEEEDDNEDEDHAQFPHLTSMTRQYLIVPVRSASPERLFSSVGLVKSDLRGRLLGTTLIDVMLAK
jgi:hypothetical protein